MIVINKGKFNIFISTLPITIYLLSIILGLLGHVYGTPIFDELFSISETFKMTFTVLWYSHVLFVLYNLISHKFYKLVCAALLSINSIVFCLLCLISLISNGFDKYPTMLALNSIVIPLYGTIAAVVSIAFYLTYNLINKNKE
ncbi:MAG: hypothetical protein CFH44_00303 [Proteobacteria bacterium]|nr:MAG: hypothetical protein CFH44_00303 [Pseudomonadota bacterium]